MIEKQKKSMIAITNQNSNVKIHWKMNPNKNYLGHQDLIGGNDVILEIASAKWEFVENPTKKNTGEEKRVVRFVETPENKLWLKPWICNETNMNMIIKVTGEKFMEDSIGKKIQIGVDVIKLKSEEVDCLRVRNVLSSFLDKDGLTEQQQQELLNLLNVCKSITLDAILNAYKVKSLKEIKEVLFEKIKNRILSKIEEEKGIN